MDKGDVRVNEKVKTSDFGFITFNAEDIKEILKLFDMEDVNQVNCWFCDAELGIDKVGHILPDTDKKPLFLCASPVCFAGYCNEKLED